MMLIFEASPPFRFKPKLERYPLMLRLIWGWFAVAIFRYGINDLKHSFAVDYANGEIEIPQQFRRYLKRQGMEPIEQANDPVGGVAQYICRDGSGKTWIAWYSRRPFANWAEANECTARAYPNGGGFEGPDGHVPALINGLWYWVRETP